MRGKSHKATKEGKKHSSSSTKAQLDKGIVLEIRIVSTIGMDVTLDSGVSRRCGCEGGASGERG